MKKIALLVISLLVLVYVMPLSINAHPGRTDENGGHVCRTNCEQYGLEYGQYHYHGYSDNNNRDNSRFPINQQNNNKTITISTPVIIGVIIVCIFCYYGIKEKLNKH